MVISGQVGSLKKDPSRGKKGEKDIAMSKMGKKTLSQNRTKQKKDRWGDT